MRGKCASHHVADCSSPFCQLEAQKELRTSLKIFCVGASLVVLDQRQFCSVLKTFLIVNYWGDAIGFWWVETRDDAKHFVMPRTALTTKNYLVQIVNSAEVKKSWDSPIIFSFFQRGVSKLLPKESV